MEVVEQLRRRHCVEPAAVASAPGRVNLIGEHLDYNGGLSLPIALPCRTYVAVAPRSDGRLVVDTLQEGDRVELATAELAPGEGGWAGYVLGVVWALASAGDGLTLMVDGRVPLGAGLSSSAALECATAVAVDALTGAGASADQLVDACVRAENDYVGAPTGTMDQTVSMLAEEGHALLLDFAAGDHRQVPWRPAGELVVIDTRASHALVGGEYGERRRACEEAAATLGVEHLALAAPEQLERLTDPVQRRRAAHVVSETARVRELVAAVEQGDWRRVGTLMTESHASLRDDYEVSCRELDVAVAAALAHGAYGARMTGGGFGGSAIALVPPGRGEEVRSAVTHAFAAEGLAPPAFVDGTASGPAEVVTPGR
ncbi:MAG TPA: galactokinase [Marmoricola sp.]|nr:galactokinase [Marmoricola sp.]